MASVNQAPIAASSPSNVVNLIPPPPTFKSGFLRFPIWRIKSWCAHIQRQPISALLLQCRQLFLLLRLPAMLRQSPFSCPRSIRLPLSHKLAVSLLTHPHTNAVLLPLLLQWLQLWLLLCLPALLWLPFRCPQSHRLQRQSISDYCCSESSWWQHTRLFGFTANSFPNEWLVDCWLVVVKSVATCTVRFTAWSWYWL